MSHSSAPRLLRNATLVTPDTLLPNAALLIEEGRIKALGCAATMTDQLPREIEVCDLQGAYILPGLIDLHTDTLEKEITPRPGADFPVEIAVQELDRKLVACGITTVYHSLHFGYVEAEKSAASRFSRREVVEGVRSMSAHTLAKTRIHLRYEIVGEGMKAEPLVRALIEEDAVELLSFMDHTPGQGQYTRDLFLDRQKKQGLDEATALQRLAEKQARPRLSTQALRRLAELANSRGIPVASHDDDTVEKVAMMHGLGVSVCEFPITLEAARHARALGMEVLGGASNVLRGGSLTGNLHVADAIRAGAVNGLCSDYYPPAMLHAVFRLWREGVLSLPEAVAAATLVPARAAGIADQTGSLALGKDADLIVVAMRGTTPVVHQTYVGGERVHAAGREARLPLSAPSLSLSHTT